MPGVILPPKFLFDDMTHQRTGPDPSFQPVSHRTAIQNVAQPLAIIPAEVRRPPAAVPFQQAFFAVPIPLIDPQRNGAAMHLEMVGDLTRGVPIQAHQDPLDAQHHPRLFIPLGLFSEFQQLGDGCLFALRKVWAHIAIITHFTNNVDLFMRVYIVQAFLRLKTASRLVFTSRPSIRYGDPAALSMRLEGISLKAATELFTIRKAICNSEDIATAHQLTNGHAFWLDLLAVQIARNGAAATLCQLLGSGTPGKALLPTDTLKSIWSTLNDRQQLVLRIMAESVRPSTVDEIAEC